MRTEKNPSNDVRRHHTLLARKQQRAATDCAYERASEVHPKRKRRVMRRSVSTVPNSVAVWWPPAEGITGGASVSHWKRPAVGTLVSIF